MADDDAKQQADEVEALKAIYGEENIDIINSACIGVLLTEPRAHEQLMIRFLLPADYPSATAPSFELVGPLVNRLPRYGEALESALEAEQTTREAGEVVLFQLTELARLAAAEVAEVAEAAEAEAAADAAADAADADEARAAEGEVQLLSAEPAAALDAAGVAQAERAERRAELAERQGAGVVDLAKAKHLGEPIVDRRSAFQSHLVRCEPGCEFLNVRPAVDPEAAAPTRNTVPLHHVARGVALRGCAAAALPEGARRLAQHRRVSLQGL